MYEHSRTLYRELKPFLMPERNGSVALHRTLLGACEDTLVQLASDAPPAAPGRHLFAQVRGLFPAREQLRVRGVIDGRVKEFTVDLDRRRADEGASLLRCAAANRRGRPCGREPLRGSRYCPSHQHLGERRDTGRLPASAA